MTDKWKKVANKAKTKCFCWFSPDDTNTRSINTELANLLNILWACSYIFPYQSPKRLVLTWYNEESISLDCFNLNWWFFENSLLVIYLSNNQVHFSGASLQCLKRFDKCYHRLHVIQCHTEMKNLRLIFISRCHK